MSFLHLSPVYSEWQLLQKPCWGPQWNQPQRSCPWPILVSDSHTNTLALYNTTAHASSLVHRRTFLNMFPIPCLSVLNGWMSFLKIKALSQILHLMYLRSYGHVIAVTWACLWCPRDNTVTLVTAFMCPWMLPYAEPTLMWTTTQWSRPMCGIGGKLQVFVMSTIP